MGVIDQAKAAMGDLAGRIGQVLSSGVDSLGETIESIDAASPLLREIGCNVAEIRLTLGLSPAVSIRVIRERRVDDRAFEQFFERHADRALICSLAKIIRQAGKVQDRIQLKHRCCNELEIELGVPPVVHLVYDDHRATFRERLAFLVLGRRPRAHRFGR